MTFNNFSSQETFIGNRRLENVIAADSEELRQVGGSFNEMAVRMDYIIGLIDTGKVDIGDFLPGEDHIKIESILRTRGMQGCPFGDQGGSNAEYMIRNVETGKKLTINHLTSHLARKHRLLEKDNQYGVSAMQFYENFMPKSRAPLPKKYKFLLDEGIEGLDSKSIRELLNLGFDLFKTEEGTVMLNVPVLPPIQYSPEGGKFRKIELKKFPNQSAVCIETPKESGTLIIDKKTKKLHYHNQAQGQEPESEIWDYDPEIFPWMVKKDLQIKELIEENPDAALRMKYNDEKQKLEFHREDEIVYEEDLVVPKGLTLEVIEAGYSNYLIFRGSKFKDPKRVRNKPLADYLAVCIVPEDVSEETDDEGNLDFDFEYYMRCPWYGCGKSVQQIIENTRVNENENASAR
jgi:hypothetical protein